MRRLKDLSERPCFGKCGARSVLTKAEECFTYVHGPLMGRESRWPRIASFKSCLWGEGGNGGPKETICFLRIDKASDLQSVTNFRKGIDERPVEGSRMEGERSGGPARSLRALRDGLAYPQPTYNYNGTNIEIAVADAYYAGTVMFPQEFADIDPDTTADEIFEFFYSTPLMTEMNAAGVGFNPLTIGKRP